MEQVRVGDRFTVQCESRWQHGPDRGRHLQVLLVEVVDVTRWQVSWNTLQVLSDTGGPPVGGRPAPTVGGIATNAVDEMIAAGIYSRVDSRKGQV